MTEGDILGEGYEGYVRVCQRYAGRDTDMFGEDYELRAMSGLWQAYDRAMAGL